MSNSDNKFGKCCGCPALMEDGRIYTSFVNNARLNGHVRKINKNSSHHKNRLFLQKNAEKIMANERVYLHTNYMCNKEKLDAHSSCNDGSFPISGNELNY